MDGYRLFDLGGHQFDLLCEAVLAELGAMPEPLEVLGLRVRTTLVEHPIPLPSEVLPPPVRVLTLWVGAPTDVPDRSPDEEIEESLRQLATTRRARSLLVLSDDVLDDRRMPMIAWTGARAMMGPAEISAMIDASPGIRFRVPTVLGLRRGSGEAGDAERRSTGDLAAARTLAPRFVPTGAYHAALETLRRHGFAVLTGPPEMGKTAIARMIGLAALSDGWELHECVRPDEVWERFARDRRQVFIADDAFGSTEYRPDAAERWANELPRILPETGPTHWLIWTSRPTPLKAGLARIRREHGTERFPQPAEVHVSAADLGVAEKALILFRHARAADLDVETTRALVANGWTIVDHAYLTPERIRRLIETRLRGLVEAPWAHLLGTVAAAVEEEIATPTAAMVASLDALDPEHRAVLVAMLDAPPGPVPERELAATVRRHFDEGLARPAAALVDRLADHFLRPVPPTSVTWVHPSWRDLVIDHLASDAEARARFVGRATLDGLLLALSVGGGTGGRTLPLLVADADWDAATGRLFSLVPRLGISDQFRLLAALDAAWTGPLDPRAADELRALTRTVLDLVRRALDRGSGPVPTGLLHSWFDLRRRWAIDASPPDLARNWVELAPTAPIDIRSHAELDRFDDWLRLVELALREAPDLVAGFPASHQPLLDSVVRDAEALAADEPGAALGLLATVLSRLATLTGDRDQRVASTVELLPAVPAPLPRPSSWGSGGPGPDRALVRRILSDL